MILDWHLDPDLPCGHVIDLDTGQPIPHVFRLDTETGEYHFYVTEGDLPRLVVDWRSGGVIIARGRGRVRFEPFEGEPIIVGAA